MELCDEIIKGLELLKDEQIIKYDELENLIRLVWQFLDLRLDDLENESFRSTESMIQLKEELNRQNYDQRRLFFCLESIYIETSRLNLNLEDELNELRLQLDNLNIQSNLKQLIIDTYKDKKDLRTKFNNKLKGMRLDSKQQFIDQFKEIELTKDSVVKSTRKTNYRHIIQTEYLMNVQTDYTKHLFTCSIQNIEDLSIKFKEIMKTVDRVFTMVKK